MIIRTQAFQQNRTKKLFEKWTKSFNLSNAELLIGGNLDPHGGVRNHIHAIAKYTSIPSLLVPESSFTSRNGTGWFTQSEKLFLALSPPKNTKYLHSHVDPCFINWCHRNRDNLKWIHTHHAMYHEESEPDGLTTWQQNTNDAGLFALRHCDHALVVSRWQRDLLRDKYAIKTTYLPNGVDAEKCTKANATIFRRKYSITKDFFLWLGRNEAVKNPTELLIAASHLPQINFIMAGHLCDRKNLEKILGGPLPENVSPLGPLSSSDAQDAIAASKAIIVTSKREGLPTLILEAMVQRKPVVSSDAEGCIDALDNGRLGFIYRRKNISELCDRILEVSDSKYDPEHAYKFVIDEFSWKHLIVKLEAIYRPLPTVFTG